MAGPARAETSPSRGPVRPGRADTARGITKPIVDENLSARTNGTIAKIHFKQGDTVKAGDVIIEFHKEVEELEVARRKLVWESKVEVETAKQKVDTVALDLDATRHLFHTTKSISKEKLYEKELEYKVSVAELERLKVTESLQKLEYEMAVQQLNQRLIRSPIDGIITEIFKHVGENGEPGTPLVRLVDTKTCHFVTNIDAEIVSELKEGQVMKLKIKAGKGTIDIEGELTFISPVVDPASGLQELKVEFDNSDNKIRPGVPGLMFLDGVK